MTSEPQPDLLQLARGAVPTALRDEPGAVFQHLYALLTFHGEPDARRIAEQLRTDFERSGRPWLRPLTPHHTPLELPCPTFGGHAATVLHATFDPAVRRIASVSDDRTLRVWDVERRAELWRAEDVRTWRVLFTPDGEQVVAGLDHGPIRIWRAADGAHLADLVGHAHHPWRVAVSLDGRWLASADDAGDQRLWSLPDGRLVRPLRGHTREVTGLRFVDGDRLLSWGRDGALLLHRLRRDRRSRLVRYGSPVWTVDLHPDGERVLSTSENGAFAITPLRGRKRLQQADPRRHRLSAAWLPDGARFVTSWHGAVEVRDGHTGEVVRTLEQGRYVGGRLQVHPGGRLLAVGHLPARLIDMETGCRVRAYVGLQAFHPRQPLALAADRDSDLRLLPLDPTPPARARLPVYDSLRLWLRRDGRRLLVHSSQSCMGDVDGRVQLIDPLSGEVLVRHDGDRIRVGLSRDGRVLGLAESGVPRFFDLETGAPATPPPDDPWPQTGWPWPEPEPAEIGLSTEGALTTVHLASGRLVGGLELGEGEVATVAGRHVVTLGPVRRLGVWELTGS